MKKAKLNNDLTSVCPTDYLEATLQLLSFTLTQTLWQEGPAAISCSRYADTRA